MIRPIEPDAVERVVDIMAHAYPGWYLFHDGERDRLAQEIRDERAGPPTRRYYGVDRDGDLVGIMRLLDFRMNLYGRMVDAGGVGSVAVDFTHKKEHVAKELIEGFLRHYRARSTAIVLLYAFRTDFYYQMGFGMGPQLYEYKLPPGRLPKGPSKAHIVRLTGTDRDKEEVKALYHDHVRRTHGLIERTDEEVDELFSSRRRLVWGYRDGDGLKGYLVGDFRRENPANSLGHNLSVREFFYDESDVLAEFLTFLHSQGDQLRYIVFDTEDPHFYHLFGDARNPSDQVLARGHDVTNLAAVGLMYRVIDAQRLFDDLGEHDFGGETATVRFLVEDSFLPENGDPFVVAFEGGRARWMPASTSAEVEVRMPISTFSSLVMGVLPLRTAYRYGQAAVSDRAYVDVLDRTFASQTPPLCATDF